MNRFYTECREKVENSGQPDIWEQTLGLSAFIFCIVKNTVFSFRSLSCLRAGKLRAICRPVQRRASRRRSWSCVPCRPLQWADSGRGQRPSRTGRGLQVCQARLRCRARKGSGRNPRMHHRRGWNFKGIIFHTAPAAINAVCGRH